jgi:hypothetical protein
MFSMQKSKLVLSFQYKEKTEKSRFVEKLFCFFFFYAFLFVKTYDRCVSLTTNLCSQSELSIYHNKALYFL